MTLGKSSEDYLEAILVLKQKRGSVRSIDVARHLEYSKPSVSRAVTNLRKEGLLVMEPDGELTLTEEGLQIAEAVYERHTLLTDLLVSIGVPVDIAMQDACLMEHVISVESFDKLKQLLHARKQQPTAKQATKRAAEDAKKAAVAQPAEESGKKKSGEGKKKKKKKKK